MKGLGFIAPVSPSPDPVSLALDAVSAFVAVFSIFQARKNARQAQENEVVQAQVRLKTLMASVVTAQYDPHSTAAQLDVLRTQLYNAGQDFYNYALKFPTAGPGAIKTIFGTLVDSAWVPDVANNVGILTQVLKDLDNTIKEKNAVDGTLGFDWGNFLTDAEKVGAGIISSITGKPVTITSTPPVSTTNSSLFTDALLVLGGVIVAKQLKLI